MHKPNDNATPSASRTQIDVVIIGAGPAGLSAAIELKRQGIEHVVVLDREAEAGGIPRHCGHPPFGMREFQRLLTGPQYARRLVDSALSAGVEIRTSTTVTALKPAGKLLIADPNGTSELSARRIIYATGVRETPRSARFISGSRPGGILNTGALQSMVYLKHRRPFKRPLIIGSELVSFSAIQTCQHAGIKVQAVIEENARVTARWPVSLYAGLNRIPIFTNSKIIRIEGKQKIEALVIRTGAGKTINLPCDGLIISGKFTPESSLARCGHLEIDAGTGGPRVDQFGRCSDPTYYAAGNILRPVETAGWSWNEGRQIAQHIIMDFKGMLPEHDNKVQIICHDPLIKYSMPQVITPPLGKLGFERLQLRVSGPAKGHICASRNGEIIFRKKINSHPERRLTIPVEKLLSSANRDTIELTIQPQHPIKPENE